MKNIIFLPLKTRTFILYKKALSLVLAFIMLFNLTGDIFASSFQVNKDLQLSKDLQEDLIKAYNQQEDKAAAKEKSLFDKMQNAKVDYVIAMAKYDMASQLVYFPEMLDEIYDKILTEFKEAKAKLDIEDEKIDAELRSPSYVRYKREKDAYLRWKEQKRDNKAKIKQLEKEINQINQEQKKTKRKEAKKAEIIQDKRNQIKDLQDEISQGDKNWEWFEEEEEYINTILTPRIDAYNEAARKHNSAIENYEQDVRLQGQRELYNKVIDDWYGGNTVPEGIKLKADDDYKSIYQKYQIFNQKLALLVQEYKRAAANYVAAANAYYDDLWLRFQLFEKKTNDEQCKLAQEVYNQRQAGKDAIDSSGWKAIPWLNKDQLKNSTNQGIRESLTWTWNTCATGRAWVNNDTLDNLYKNSITPDEYIRMKFLGYYEEYIPQNQRSYENKVIYKNGKDYLSYAYNFKFDKSAAYKDGIKRGRELFMLLLADYELGYAKYRASLVDSNLAKILREYIGNVDFEEQDDLFDGEDYIRIRGYNLPKRYYSLYLNEYDTQFKKIEKNLFYLVKYTEDVARGEVHRLAGNLVKKMYFEGKSINEILSEEGISKAQIDALYEKYKAEMNPENVERQKAQLKREFENRDYSGVIAYDVADKYKPTTTDKVLDGIFIWLPSTWLGFQHRIERAQEEYSRRMTYANIHQSKNFKNLLYLLSESQQSWKKYLIPLASKIKEEKQDFETAALLCDLASTQGDIDIKDLAVSTERQVYYNLQDDPFFIAKQMIIDLVSTAGLAVALKGFQSLRSARQAVNVTKVEKVALKTTSAAAQTSKIGKINNYSKVAKASKVKPFKNSGLDKVKNKLKVERQQSNMQSVRDKANFEQEKALDKSMRLSEKRHQQEIDREAQEIADYIASREGAPKIQPKQLTWLDNTKITAGYIWDQVKSALGVSLRAPKFALMTGAGLGGEIAPAVVVEQTIADKAVQETTYELVVQANTVAKETSLAQEGIAVAKEGQAVSNAARKTGFDYASFFRNSHLAPSLEPVSGGGTFKSGLGQGSFNYFTLAGAQGSRNALGTAYKKEYGADLQRIAEANYKDLTPIEIQEYINQGQVMYKNGEQPIKGVTHPIIFLAYEQEKEAQQIKELTGDMQREIFSHFAFTEHKVAAMSALPFLNIFFPRVNHYLSGGAPILNARQTEAIIQAIDQAIKEIALDLSPSDKDFKVKVAQRAKEILQGSKEFNFFDKWRLARILENYVKTDNIIAEEISNAVPATVEETRSPIVENSSLPKGKGEIYSIEESSDINVESVVNKDGSITYTNYVPIYLQTGEKTISPRPFIYLKVYGKQSVTIPAGFKFAMQEDGSIKYFVEDINAAGVKKALKNSLKVAPVDLAMTLEDMQKLKAYLQNNLGKTAVVNISKTDAFALFSTLLSLIAGADLGASLSSQLKGTFGLIAVAIAISGFGYISPLLANLFKPLVQKFGKRKMIQVGLIAMTAASILGVTAGMYGTYKLDVTNPGSWQFLSGVIFFITAITVASLFSTLASPMLSAAYPNKSVFASKNLSFTTLKGLSRMMVTLIPAVVGLATSGVNWSLLTPMIGLLSVGALVALHFSRDIDPSTTNKAKPGKDLKKKYKEIFAPKTIEIRRRLGQIYMAYGMITSVVIGIVSGFLYSPTQALWLGLGGSALNFSARKIANRLLKDNKINNDQLTGFLLPIMALSIISLLAVPYGYSMLIPWYLTQISTSTFGVAENTRMMNVVGDYYKEREAEIDNNMELSEELKDSLRDYISQERENMKLIAANKYNIRNSFGIFPILVTVALMGVFIDGQVAPQVLEFLSTLPLSSPDNTLNLIRIAIVFPALVSAVLVYQNTDMIKAAYKYVFGAKEAREISKDQIRKHYGRALIYEIAIRDLLTQEPSEDVKKAFEKYYEKAVKELKVCGKDNAQAAEMLTRLEALKAQMIAKLGGEDISTFDIDEEGFFEKALAYIKETFENYLPVFNLGEGGFIGPYTPQNTGERVSSGESNLPAQIPQINDNLPVLFNQFNDLWATVLGTRSSELALPEGTRQDDDISSKAQNALEKLRDNFLGFSEDIIADINAKIESGEITTMDEVYKALESHISRFANTTILEDDEVDAINEFISREIPLSVQEEIDRILREADKTDGLILDNE